MRGICVSVILPSYRRPELLRATVEMLKAQNWGNLEIVVLEQIDGLNNQQPSEVSSQNADGKRVRWFRMPPIGITGVRSFGVDQSNGKILLFMDDDIVVDDPLLVAKHVKNYEDPSVAAVCGQVLHRDKPPKQVLPKGLDDPLSQALHFPRDYSRRVEAYVWCTNNGSIRKSVYNEIGGFDALREGASSGDDADLAYRLAKAGKRVVFDPEASVVHLLAGRGGLRLTGGKYSSPWRDQVQSHFIFLFRHVRGWVMVPYFVDFILRKTILLRANFVRPWRWPGLICGIIDAFFEARVKLARRGRQNCGP